MSVQEVEVVIPISLEAEEAAAIDSNGGKELQSIIILLKSLCKTPIFMLLVDCCLFFVSSFLLLWLSCPYAKWGEITTIKNHFHTTWCVKRCFIFWHCCFVFVLLSLLPLLLYSVQQLRGKTPWTSIPIVVQFAALFMDLANCCIFLESLFLLPLLLYPWWLLLLQWASV